MSTEIALRELIEEYDRSLQYTDALWRDLTLEQVHWRPNDESSAIGWHLGHQAAVAHFMVRNLTAAEPPIDDGLDRLMDSATPEVARGDLPNLDRIRTYRDTVAERVKLRVGNIDKGKVGAPEQLRSIAQGMLMSIINHEYQHSKWVGEVRHDQFGLDLPADPISDRLSVVDGYQLLG